MRHLFILVSVIMIFLIGVLGLYIAMVPSKRRKKADNIKNIESKDEKQKIKAGK